MPRRLPFLLGCFFATALVVDDASAQKAAPKAGDQDASACIQGFESVQSQREAGKLRAARESAISCARDTCPKAISTECATWLSELSQSLPSVVFAATGPKGEDLATVNVYFGAELITSSLTSRAVPVDPGKYTVKFESAEHGTREMTVIIREGEKNRKVSVSFEPNAPPPNAAEPEVERPIPVAMWVVGSIGAAAVIGGVVFESLGLVQKSELDECKPNCAPDDVDEMMRNFVIGDVALVTGGLLLGAALVVFLTRPSIPKDTTTTSAIPSLMVVPGLRGGAAAATWTF